MRFSRCFKYLGGSPCLSLPPPSTDDGFCTNIPLVFINLDKSTERRRVLERAFLQCPTNRLSRFKALSRADFAERGPQSAANDPQKYYDKHRCTAGEAGLVASHAKVLEEFLSKSDAPMIIVLEDDASPKLLKLSWFHADLEQALKDVFEHTNIEGIFLQRIILPRQVPTIVTGSFLSRPLSRQLLIYTSNFGFAGSTAIAWSRKGAERFLDRHRDVNGTFGCPIDGGECALDMDLHRQAHLGSVFPPLMSARLSVGDSLIRPERKSNGARDAQVHLQSYVSATFSSMMIFESFQFQLASENGQADYGGPTFAWFVDEYSSSGKVWVAAAAGVAGAMMLLFITFARRRLKHE